ncbi:hypothetical protein [Kribbella deserti]|uniref:WD40 repeat domain-containing protein n=1 Tax=Kribbella deserti TaxID=1926257 RepID=A0ABV6QNV3_9ACTN
MSNDTEARLRDYLEAKALTVADDTPAPIQQFAHRRRHWPVLVAAAAVVALVVPLALHFDDRRSAPEPAMTSTLVWKAGAGKVSTIAKPSALRVPYLLSTPDISEPFAAVYDGKTRVTLPRTQDARLIGRVANGWLLKLTNMGKPSELGILDRAGRFALLTTYADWVALSPDRSKVAVGQIIGKKSRIVSIDLATGRQLDALTAPFDQIHVYGWNRDGVWYSEYNRGNNNPQPRVWQPGSKERVVEMSGFSSLKVAADSDRLVVNVAGNGQGCQKVVSLTASGTFEVVRESCASSKPAIYPFPSPNGEFIANPDRRFALHVDNGKQIKLTGLSGAPDPINNVYEDSNHLLVNAVTSYAFNAPQVINRCDVRSGKCRVVHRQSGKYTIGLGTP